jgi:hypothetical protein
VTRIYGDSCSDATVRCANARLPPVQRHTRRRRRCGADKVSILSLTVGHVAHHASSRWPRSLLCGQGLNWVRRTKICVAPDDDCPQLPPQIQRRLEGDNHIPAISSCSFPLAVVDTGHSPLFLSSRNAINGRFFKYSILFSGLVGDCFFWSIRGMKWSSGLRFHRFWSSSNKTVHLNFVSVPKFV